MSEFLTLNPIRPDILSFLNRGLPIQIRLILIAIFMCFVVAFATAMNTHGWFDHYVVPAGIQNSKDQS